jgi:hypothetical protein
MEFSMRIPASIPALLILTLLSTGAAAQSPTPLFTPDQDVCFGRLYDRNHLASHPNQKVTSLHVFHAADGRREAENYDPKQKADAQEAFRERGETAVSAFVTFRDRRGMFNNTLICEKDSGAGVRCYIECDGGSFMLKGESNDTVVLDNNGFVLVGGCGEDVEATESVFLDPGKDDKTFRLDRKAASVCRAEEQKARPIPAGLPLRERFKDNETFCFGRDYDAAHLASHPQQKVASIRVGRLTPDQERTDKDLQETWPSDVKLTVALKLKASAGGRTTNYTCNPREATWDCSVISPSDDKRTTCDGNIVQLSRGPGNDVLLLNNQDGLPIEAACRPTATPEGTDTGGRRTRSDDRSFRLSRMPVEACRP